MTENPHGGSWPGPGSGLPPYPGGPYPGVLSPGEERTWALFAHLSPFVTSVIGLGFLGPLLILLFQGEKSPYVRYHAVEALNFQIAILIQALVMAITCIGLILLLPAVIFWLVVMIIAAVRANQGEWYRYPLIWRWVK